jgi:hypothetical protein
MSVHLVVLDGLRLRRGDSALALLLSRPARASLALRPARSLTRPEGGPLSPERRWFGRPPIFRVATKVYRHLLGPDLHRLRGLTFHGTLADLSTAICRSTRDHNRMKSGDFDDRTLAGLNRFQAACAGSAVGEGLLGGGNA